MYSEPDASCDWCGGIIYDKESVACGKCYEKAESALAAAQDEIELLRGQIAELESERERSRP